LDRKSWIKPIDLRIYWKELSAHILKAKERKQEINLKILF
jgi:hypothetical protein